jgi:hypothetical protein
MMQPEAPSAPSKIVKVFTVAAFFMFLFFLAGTIGLPIPVGLVFVFFVSVAFPGAIVLALLTVGVFKIVTRGETKPNWPLFDIGLQTFIMLALISTGVFVIRFPSWLQESYPSIREEVAKQLSPDHTAAEKESFLVNLDRFWEWNVRFLLQEGTPPSEVQQQTVRDTVSKFGEYLTPDCENCESQLSVKETRELGKMMSSLAPNGLTNTTEQVLSPLAGAAEATSAATATTAATLAVSSPTAVTQTP